MFSLQEHPAAAKMKASDWKRRRIVINDVNGELVCAYRAMRNDIDGLVSELRSRENNTSESDYYKARDLWVPGTETERAGRMIYLNRLAFNGLYRVRGDGKFNVPFGKIENPTVCNEDLLRVNSKWLTSVDIREGSFTSAVNDAEAGDVVYFDPPYLPLTTTASFSKYAKDDFREIDQWALRGVVDGLIQRGVHVVLSNSNTELTRTIFANLNLYVVSANRSISAAAGSRNRVEEVLGISYKIGQATNPAELKKLQVYKKAARG